MLEGALAPAAAAIRIMKQCVRRPCTGKKELVLVLHAPKQQASSSSEFPCARAQVHA